MEAAGNCTAGRVELLLIQQGKQQGISNTNTRLMPSRDKLRQLIGNMRRKEKGKTDVDHVRTILTDPNNAVFILHPKLEKDMPTADSDWIIVSASPSSLREIIVYGHKIVGLDGCFKLIKYLKYFYFMLIYFH